MDLANNPTPEWTPSTRKLESHEDIVTDLKNKSPHLIKSISTEFFSMTMKICLKVGRRRKKSERDIILHELTGQHPTNDGRKSGCKILDR